MPTPVNSVMLSGHAVNMPRRSEKNADLVTFRIASTQTWWNGTEWKDKDTVYIDVQCWRNLGQNVLSSVVKGMPVVISGELTLFEYLPEDGPVDRNSQPVKQRLYRVRATTVGTDLNWARVLRWAKRTGDRDAVDTPAADSPDTTATPFTASTASAAPLSSPSANTGRQWEGEGVGAGKETGEVASAPF